MKYIIGAGIGGLFGLSAPFVIEAREINNNELRQEAPQQIENSRPILSSPDMQRLPNNVCHYMDLQSEDLKEQAKECLSIDIIAVPAIQYVDIIHLEPGGVVIDHKTGEVGLLMRRYDIVEHVPFTLDMSYDVDGKGLWAWEILWTGKSADKNNRYFPYTETGLLNMIRMGTFEYVACEKK